MKKLISIILCFSFLLIKSQYSTFVRTHIKILKEDSTKSGSFGDTSYVFNALVLTHTIGGISGFSLTCKIYDKHTKGWVLEKDTSYLWSEVSRTTHDNQVNVVCKPNNNTLKVCLGRLDPAIRRKFIFKVTGSNGPLTKEFNF